MALSAPAHRRTLRHATLGLLGLALAAGLGLGLLVLRAPPAAVAQTTECVHEREPNDQPPGATPIRGAGCADGRIDKTGDQDLFAWKVDGSGAKQLWTFALTPAPGILTKLQVFHVDFAADGKTVTGNTQLFEVDSADGSPITSPPYLFLPGTYYLGIAAADAGAYRLAIAAAPLPPSGDKEPNDQAGAPAAVQGAISLSGDLQGSEDWYGWTLSQTDAAQRWDLVARVPVGVNASLALTKADGSQLASVDSQPDGQVALYDLGLAPGTYQLHLSPAQNQSVPYVLSTTASGPRDPTREEEPDDDVAHAFPITTTQVTTGRLARAGDLDFYRVTMDPALARQQVTITLTVGAGVKRKLCLEDAKGQDIQCREGTDVITLPGLVLAAGEHTIKVSGDADPARPYAIRFVAGGATAGDVEAEPNDTIQTATSLLAGHTMRGHLTGSDADVFRLTVEGAPQLWKIQVLGKGATSLALFDAAGDTLVKHGVDPDTGRGQIANLFLLPGDHWIRVDGQDADYALRAIPTGPPDPNGEREPNDDAGHSQVLAIGQTRNGFLADPDDRDVYRFSLAAPEHVALRIEPPADGAITFNLEWDTVRVLSARSAAPGQPLVYEALLQPGDYMLYLTAAQVSAAPYHLRLDRLDPFTLPSDLEPNDTSAQARALPPTLAVSGTVGQFGDEDWYALPPLTQATTVTIRQTAALPDPSAVSLSLFDGQTPLTLTPDATGKTFQGELPASKALLLRVSGSGPYGLQLAFAAGPTAQPAPATLPVTLALPGGFRPRPPPAAAPPDGTPAATPIASPTASPAAPPLASPSVSSALPPVAAYWPQGQRVETALTLTNRGSQAQDLTLAATTSHYLWHADLGQTDISLKPGETATVPLTVRVDPDAWANQPVQVTVVARGSGGAQQTVAVNLVATGDAAPVNPAQTWLLPQPLLGGLDVAATALGAKPVSASDGQTPDNLAPLFDGYAPLGAGFKSPAADLATTPLTVTVQLAGDKPLPIAGVTLNPAGAGVTAEHLKDFDVLVSTDGSTFTPVYSGTLSPLPIEQAFVFAQPVQARYAQLRLRSNYEGNNGNVILGEWKVIAPPGVVPSGAGVNLADPSNGGHVVWSNPQISQDPGVVRDILSEGGNLVTLGMDAGTTSEWVVGFRDDRAARITELQWVNAPSGIPDQRFAAVDVAVSTVSPLGPWQPLGTWRLDPKASGPLSFKVQQPTWARFVRFTARGPEKEPAPRAFPATLRILEQATGGDYRSILTEWGQDRQPAIYETLVTAKAANAPTSGDNHSRDRAQPLQAGGSAQGQVRVTRQDDWYKIVAPPGRDTLRFTVTGAPTVGVELAVEDESGKPVKVSAKPVSAAETVYTVPVTPGRTYYVRVTQPPHSIVFTFDTSLSIGDYSDRVYQALTSFGGDIVPGEEAANFLPFGDEFLLPTWGDQPYLLQAAVNNYPRMAGSSSAEDALLKASGALRERSGTRAIVVITDAETSSYQDNAKLWTALPGTLPRIFSVQIGAGDDPAETQAWMQDWTTVNGGYYTYVHTQGDMDIAFDRASTWLRRPAPYTLTVDAVTLATPTPRPTPTAPPTPTPQPTATPVPTATPEPTATPTPVPTATPTAAPTPTPTPSPVARQPGAVQVLAAPAPLGQPAAAPIASGVAVELILDTSGSMLQTLPDGQSKIDDAKAVLSDLVTNRLPAGAPLALRVFGTEPGSCDTTLAVPLQPLDPQAVAGQINQIQVVDEVKTPIGASLQLVAQDLQGAPGPKIVVLVTDGEETCGGDPTAAINQLIAQGIEVHVNIVGLALDDPALQAEYRDLAQKTGGSYFDAGSQADLGTAITQALQAPFRVKDASGATIATGIVGGAPILVPPGTYTIEVLTNPAQEVPNVPIQSGNTTRVTLQPPQALAVPPSGPVPAIQPQGTAGA